MSSDKPERELTTETGYEYEGIKGSDLLIHSLSRDLTP
jgi:hypothetical protein